MATVFIVVSGSQRVCRISANWCAKCARIFGHGHNSLTCTISGPLPIYNDCPAACWVIWATFKWTIWSSALFWYCIACEYSIAGCGILATSVIVAAKCLSISLSHTNSHFLPLSMAATILIAFTESHPHWYWLSSAVCSMAAYEFANCRRPFSSLVAIGPWISCALHCMWLLFPCSISLVPNRLCSGSLVICCKLANLLSNQSICDKFSIAGASTFVIALHAVFYNIDALVTEENESFLTETV